MPILIIQPIYIYALAGIISGFFGGRITAPASDTGASTWNPKQHSQMMLMCRKTCNNHVFKYEPFTGDCTCRK